MNEERVDNIDFFLRSVLLSSTKNQINGEQIKIIFNLFYANNSLIETPYFRNKNDFTV